MHTPPLTRPVICFPARRISTSPWRFYWTLSSPPISPKRPCAKNLSLIHISIVLVLLKDPQKAQSIQPFVKLHKLLRRAGIPMDLCILYREGGQYDRPAVDAIRWVLKTEDIDSLLGQRGGIHLVDEMRHEEQNIQALKASAVHIASEHLLPEAASPTEYRPMPVAPVEPIGAPPAGFTVEGGVFHGDAFTITKTPPMPWGHVMANPTFGTMVGDLALGYTWAVNARENKLTPWYNDSRTDNRGEQLLLRLDGRIYDCTLGAVATFTPGYARWEGMAGDVRITVTASVPPKGTWKEVLLEMESPNRPVDIQAAYYTEPVSYTHLDVYKRQPDAFEEVFCHINHADDGQYG